MPKTITYRQIMQAEQATGIPRDQIIQYAQSKGAILPDAKQVMFPGTNAPVMERGGTVYNALNKAADFAPAVGTVLGDVGGHMASMGTAPGRVAGATFGQAGGQIIKRGVKELLGESDYAPGTSEAGGQNLKEVGTETAKTFLGTSAAELIVWGGGKLFQPIKAMLQARNAAGAASSATLSGDGWVEAGKAATEAAPAPIRNSVAKFAALDAEKYAGREIPVLEALNSKGYANQAFTNAGSVKAGAANFYNKFIGDEIRRQLADVAPEVARYDQILSKFMYPAAGFVKKAIWPAAISAGTGLGLYGTGVLGGGGNSGGGQ